MTITVVASIDENELLKWHREHIAELKKSVQECHERRSLCPLLKKGPTKLYLAENPQEIRTGDQFNVTIISGVIEQEAARLYVLYFVKQQLNPYSAVSFLLYTSNDEQHMPSVPLYLDVIKHPTTKEKRLPDDYNLHIDTLEADQEGTYIQDWTFYNHKEIQKVRLIFAPDGVGATNFGFLN